MEYVASLVQASESINDRRLEEVRGIILSIDSKQITPDQLEPLGALRKQILDKLGEFDQDAAPARVVDMSGALNYIEELVQKHQAPSGPAAGRGM